MIILRQESGVLFIISCPSFNPISGINIVIIAYIFITEMSLFISSKQLKITGYNFQAEHAKGLQ